MKPPPKVHVIGIDPGLDVTGLAYLTKVGTTVVVQDVTSARTKPGEDMSARLWSLQLQVTEQLQKWAAASGTTFPMLFVALEVPTNVGRSHKAKRAGGENVVARSMSLFWQALGAVRCGIVGAGLSVVELPPGGAKKEYRQSLYGRWTISGKNPDERDAIVIACTQLFSTASTAAIATLGREAS